MKGSSSLLDPTKIETNLCNLVRYGPHCVPRNLTISMKRDFTPALRAVPKQRHARYLPSAGGLGKYLPWNNTPPNSRRTLACIKDVGVYKLPTTDCVHIVTFINNLFVISLGSEPETLIFR